MWQMQYPLQMGEIFSNDDIKINNLFIIIQIRYDIFNIWDIKLYRKIGAS